MLVTRRYHDSVVFAHSRDKADWDKSYLDLKDEYRKLEKARKGESESFELQLKAARKIGFEFAEDFEKEKEKNHFLSGDNESLRANNEKARQELVTRFNMIEDLKDELHRKKDEVLDLKQKLEEAYKKILPIKKKKAPKKRSPYIKKNPDNTLDIGDLVFIPETKTPKKKTRKVSSNGIRNIRRRKGPDS